MGYNSVVLTFGNLLSSALLNDQLIQLQLLRRSFQDTLLDGILRPESAYPRVNIDMILACVMKRKT